MKVDNKTVRTMLALLINTLEEQTGYINDLEKLIEEMEKPKAKAKAKTTRAGTGFKSEEAEEVA